jgi:hypothetical protein
MSNPLQVTDEQGRDFLLVDCKPPRGAPLDWGRPREEVMARARKHFGSRFTRANLEVQKSAITKWTACERLTNTNSKRKGRHTLIYRVVGKKHRLVLSDDPVEVAKFVVVFILGGILTQLNVAEAMLTKAENMLGPRLDPMARAIRRLHRDVQRLRDDADDIMADAKPLLDD